MHAFDMIRLLAPDLEPKLAKIHLASWNGRQYPLDEFLTGRFFEWQSYQTQKNFERPFVLSLIKLEARDQWLFCGLHRVQGPCELGPDPDPASGDKQCWRYPLEEEPACSELTGRLVVSFTRPGRQSYLNAETWANQITLAEIYPRRLSIGEFPGYRSIDLSFDELCLVVSQALDGWRSALSSVAGVYLISDAETGDLYVGAASGAGGIWQRWSDYAATGYGGNVELRALVNGDGMDRARQFRFSVLEIADIHTGDADVIAREAHWKRVLLSRSHGLNGN